jgi:FKBP-type peptidyl-prolyl cis-trans isomerase
MGVLAERGSGRCDDDIAGRRGKSGNRQVNVWLQDSPSGAVQWENVIMQKFLTSTAVLLAAGMMLAGNALAQQTPAAPPSTTTPAKTATGTTKTGTATTAKKAAPAPLTLTTPKQKTSYAIGVSIGKKLHDDGLDIDTAILIKALKDAVAGNKLLMTDDEMRTSLTSLAQDMQKKQQEKQQEGAAKNKKDGEDFLAANKAKEGVVTTPSGLQYKILQAGTGPKPAATDSVVCNYKGTFVDGKEFDSSYKRGEPATFPVTGVIKGWTEALQMMPVGSKWQLVIPADLAYGEQGRRGMPPNSTLVFEVELVKIAEKTLPPAAPAAPATPPPATTPPPSGKPDAPPQPK